MARSPREASQASQRPRPVAAELHQAEFCCPYWSPQLISDEKLEREVEIDVWDPVDRRHVDDRRLEYRNVEERFAPGLRPRRTGGHITNKKFRSGCAADRLADNELDLVPINLLSVLFRRNDRGECRHVKHGVAAADIKSGNSNHIAQQRGQMVALNIGNF